MEESYMNLINLQEGKSSKLFEIYISIFTFFITNTQTLNCRAATDNNTYCLTG